MPSSILPSRLWADIERIESDKMEDFLFFFFLSKLSRLPSVFDAKITDFCRDLYKLILILRIEDA